MSHPQIRNKGRTANVKLHTMEIAPYIKVRSIIVSIFIHVPAVMDLSQKKAIGVHCSRVAKNIMRLVKKVRPIAM